MKKFKYLIITFMFVFGLGNLPAANAVTDLPSDNRIKILQYDANDIYTIYTLYGYQTNIEFGRNERIQTISVGDRSLWQIVPSGYRLFIRPMDDNVTTNMTVITDRRTYQFDLKSGSGNLSNNPRMVYVAKFDYPPPPQPIPVPVFIPPAAAATPPMMVKPLVAMPPAEPVKTVELAPAPPPSANPPAHPIVFIEADDPLMDSNLNYDYTFTGPDAMAPVQLYDDGQSTYLRFADDIPRQPKLYSLDDNKQLPIILHPAGDLFVANSVHTYMLLDYGAGKNSQIYLYNEQRMPAGM